MITKYTVKYKDGTLIKDLSFDESFDLFEKALTTDNSCSVYPQETDYKPV